ncbi:MAG: translin [Candidatus Bathyarchaeota archaeon]|nr:translin [Candidatus Bathyarchaeota archaeon]MDH5787264.1 translin [Candidatus Bathyarchaeota archaeon]
MPSLKITLEGIRKELKEKEKVRENLQKTMRKTTSLSKQAILLAHQEKLKEAKKLIETVREIISKLNEAAATYPDIIYSGLYNAARQEFSEASIFLHLIEEGNFITPEEIMVPSVDYVLGLADVIGEYRRLTLDALRKGSVKEAERCLQTMDEIYIELMAMDEAYMLVPGLRRKCDIARRIIETTRGDVTQEVRRDSLEKYLKHFENLQRRKAQARKG